MRRLLLPLAVLLIALAAAACGGSEQPGWTYAPPTEPPAATPVPSGSASEAPASEAPSAGGDVVQLAAYGIKWEQTELTAPADKAFVIHFNNKDASVPHDVVIKDAAGMTMFQGARADGPVEVDYQVPPLPAGTYTFVCSFHPNMVGTLTVGG